MSAGRSEPPRSRLEAARWISLPRYSDARGHLVVVEDGPALPFPVQRFYCIHGVPGTARRGGHAHAQVEELIVALSGRFRVTLDDGASRRELLCDRPERALYVPALLWHELDDFVPGTVAGVFASRPYVKEDSIHEYSRFVRMVRG
jgi:hypothetical protein